MEREGTAGAVRFAARPLLVFWETTVACPLSCQHCRASAVRDPLPGQLSTAAAYRLLEQVAEMGPPHPVLVMTGGDCLSRPDLLELTGYARELGVKVALSPAVSDLLSPRRMRHFRDMGVRSVSISLDGGIAATHDRVRGIPGHFASTLEALSWLVGEGFRVQVNTTVMAENVGELADVAALLLELRVPVWEVFFLIEVGRGGRMHQPTPEENEDICNFLYDVSAHPLVVRTVEAPFFRRVAAERQGERQGERQADLQGERQGERQMGLETADPSSPVGPLYQALSRRLRDLSGPGPRRPRPHTVGTRDGMGVVFVSHDGEVRPSGFLPVGVGNVRQTRLAELYRGSPLLRRIRAAEFGGRCGACPYRQLCGGSRARAFAASQDPLGEDPGCSFLPAA